MARLRKKPNLYAMLRYIVTKFHGPSSYSLWDLVGYHTIKLQIDKHTFSTRLLTLIKNTYILRGVKYSSFCQLQSILYRNTYQIFIVFQKISRLTPSDDFNSKNLWKYAKWKLEALGSPFLFIDSFLFYYLAWKLC